MLGQSDHEVAALCLKEERVLVTNNAGDFFALTRTTGIHAGLVVLPLGFRDSEIEWMRAAIQTIEDLAAKAGMGPAEHMINAVVEVEAAGSCRRFDYP